MTWRNNQQQQQGPFGWSGSRMGGGWGGWGGGSGGSRGNSGNYGKGTDNYQDFEMGWNAPTLQMGMQGLNTIGNIWGAWQSNKLAKDQLNFTKKIANANLNNQVSSYNTALEDRGRSRAAAEGQTSQEAKSYIDRNRLSRD